MESMQKIGLLSALYIILGLVMINIPSTGWYSLIPFIIVVFALDWAIYYDAKERGLNENYWLLAFFLGPLGTAIYYFIAKDKKPLK